VLVAPAVLAVLVAQAVLVAPAVLAIVAESAGAVV